MCSKYANPTVKFLSNQPSPTKKQDNPPKKIGLAAGTLK